MRATALLRDIGKLAVPEHIISKPGPLTAEEFEKMKIHPAVGAEILEHGCLVSLSGRTDRAVSSREVGRDGISIGVEEGDEIPIGSRILAAVDAVLEHRLAGSSNWPDGSINPILDEVARESGRAFDPQVVEALKRRARDLERIARTERSERTDAAADLAKTALRRAAPAAGFEATAPTEVTEDKREDFLHSIASARQEVQTLFELSQDLGNSLSLDETLSVLAARLRKIIPHHTVAIYTRREDRLVAEYVHGEEYRLFSSLEIPLGQGLSGWVAERHQAIINGNPSVEPGYLNDPTKFSALRSALAVPLSEGGGGLQRRSLSVQPGGARGGGGRPAAAGRPASAGPAASAGPRPARRPAFRRPLGPPPSAAPAGLPSARRRPCGPCLRRPCGRRRRPALGPAAYGLPPSAPRPRLLPAPGPPAGPRRRRPRPAHAHCGLGPRRSAPTRRPAGLPHPRRSAGGGRLG